MLNLVKTRPNLVNTMFDSFFEESLFPTNYRDETKHYALELEIPGATKNDLKMSIRGNCLTVYGKKKKNNFNYSWNIPPDVNIDAIEATYADGVLNVMLPKNEGRIIEIK